MSTRYSDIFTGNENYEEFYINGSQIKEAWLNGECIWALGSDVSTIIWLARHSGYYYLYYVDTSNKRHIGKGEELGTIDIDLELNVADFNRDQSAMNGIFPVFCDEGIVLYSANTTIPNMVHWLDYDLESVKPSSTLHLNKCYCAGGIVIGNKYLAIPNAASSYLDNSIRIIDFTAGRLLKNVSTNYAIPYMSTDGANIIFRASSQDINTGAFSGINNFAYKKINLMSVTVDDPEIVVNGIFALHQEKFTELLQEIMVDEPDITNVVCTQITSSYPITASSLPARYVPYCIGNRIITNLNITFNGTGYSTSRQETVEFFRTGVIQLVISTSGGVYSIEKSDDYPVDGTITSIGKSLFFTDGDNFSLYFGNRKINGFSGVSSLATEDEGYNYIAYLSNANSGIFAKTDIVKQEIPFSY